MPNYVRSSNFEQFWKAEIILYSNMQSIFSKPLFRGRKFDLKFCTFLRYPKRVHSAFQVILFCSNGLIDYRKIEYFWYTLISFGITPNFRSNLRPLNIDLEKNALHIWIQNDLSFSKLFKIWKSDKLWQMNNPNLCIVYKDWPNIVLPNWAFHHLLKSKDFGRTL